MKYLQKITLSLLAIVVMALGSNATATTHTFDPDNADIIDSGVYTSAGDSILVNDDASVNGTGKAVILTGASTVPLDVLHGILKVGDIAALGAKTTTDVTTVRNGAILEITAATANCIAGDLEVNAGGILQVDDNIPASGGPFASGADLIVHNGAIIKLGAGVTWSKDVTVS
jgi:hypothetical protein